MLCILVLILFFYIVRNAFYAVSLLILHALPLLFENFKPNILIILEKVKGNNWFSMNLSPNLNHILKFHKDFFYAPLAVMGFEISNSGKPRYVMARLLILNTKFFLPSNLTSY